MQSRAKRYLFHLPTHLRKMLEHEGELDSNGRYPQTHPEYYMTTLRKKSADALCGHVLMVTTNRGPGGAPEYWMRPIRTVDRAVILGHKKVFRLIVNAARDSSYPRTYIINKALKFLIREGRSDWLSKYVGLCYSSFQALSWSKKEKMMTMTLSLTDAELLECMLRMGAIVTHEAFRLALHGYDMPSEKQLWIEIIVILQQAQKKHPGSIRVMLRDNFPSSDIMNDT